MQVRNVLSRSAVLMVLVASGVAGALDQKNYAGATCQPAGATITYDTIGRIFNPSAASVAAAVCPIVRDDASGAGASWAVANMTVIDSNPAQGFSCTATSRSINGAAGFFSGASTPAAFVGTATISFAGLGKIAAGYYSILCRIPVRTAGGAVSYIASYRVVEPNPVEP